MRIVVLDGHTLNPGDNPWTDVEALGDLTVYDRTAPGQAVERAAEAEVVLTNKTPLPRGVLDRLPRLRFISVLATGYNVVDVEAARERGIPVSNVPTYGTESVGQFVFALLLELCHHVARHGELVRRGEWAQQPDFCFWATPQVGLAERRMGIVGFGRIGRRVGELAHAFGMAVSAHDPLPGPAPGYEPFDWRTVEEVVAEADVVSLHCPQTDENPGMVGARLLGLMKPGAFLINTARGGLVNEADLAAALNAGRIAGAAVDVVSEEPIRPDNPLLAARNCLITPHIAWATLGARRRLMRVTAENIAAFLAGRPINVVG
jgi:glycerate dehydrogenase